MSQILDEQLSAFLDGELPAEETELLLARLDRDASQRARLGRYAMIGECIRTGAVAPHALDVADRVRAALAAEAKGAAEAAVAAPSRARIPAGGTFGWVGGTLAASVAVVALLLAAPGIWRPSQPPPLASSGVAPPTVEPAEPVPQGAALASRRLGPQAAARLTGYLFAHVEYANQISRNNFDSRLVSARAERASWQQPKDLADAR
jgi:anti-sigma factor RsiW